MSRIKGEKSRFGFFTNLEEGAIFTNQHSTGEPYRQEVPSRINIRQENHIIPALALSITNHLEVPSRINIRQENRTPRGLNVPERIL